MASATSLQYFIVDRRLCLFVALQNSAEIHGLKSCMWHPPKILRTPRNKPRASKGLQTQSLVSLTTLSRKCSASYRLDDHSLIMHVDYNTVVA